MFRGEKKKKLRNWKIISSLTLCTYTYNKHTHWYLYMYIVYIPLAWQPIDVTWTVQLKTNRQTKRIFLQIKNHIRHENGERKRQELCESDWASRYPAKPRDTQHLLSPSSVYPLSLVWAGCSRQKLWEKLLRYFYFFFFEASLQIKWVLPVCFCLSPFSPLFSSVYLSVPQDRPPRQLPQVRCGLKLFFFLRIFD